MNGVTTGTLRPTRVQASKGWASLRLHDLWEYRDLLVMMAWRDVQVRYKQTALGVGWAILQPVLMMLVFSVFFGRLAKVPSDGLPYPIFIYTALVPWIFFANTVNQAIINVPGNAALIKKVYFPRLIIPMATILTGLVDFVIAFGVLLLLMLFYGIVPGPSALWVPAFVLLAIMTALGVGLWMGALTAMLPDVRFIAAFLIQFWMFATPVAYPSTLVPEPWRAIYALNPMVGVVEGFRWALLNTATSPYPMLVVSSTVAATLLVSGAFYYRRMERSFADVL